MARLTKLEKEMLVRAARFTLAGEWPWEPEHETKRELRKMDREHAALVSGATKLEG